MNREFDSILEQCLSQMAAGRARIESCLLSYPSLADELEPLLLVAEQMWSVPRPALSSEAQDRIEARLLDAAKPGLWSRLVAWRPPRLRLRFGRATIGLLAAFIALMLLVAMPGMVGGSLPGTLLYPVKLATEDAWLSLAPARDEAQLRLRFARRRLEEVERLAEHGPVDPAILEAMLAETEDSLVTIGKLPPALALPLLDALAALLEDQEQALSAVSATAPAALQEYLAMVLQARARQAERVQALIMILRSAEPPGQTRTPQPPGQTRTPQPPGQTRTPQPPGQTRTPQPPGQTKTPQPPGIAKTPEPPGQTRTPQPPGQTRTPQPQGQTKTPQPPGITKTPEPPGQTRTPQPPGQTKTPKPPGRSKEPKPVKAKPDEP